MTKLGVKSNALATIMCVVALASGYIGAIVVAGYILFAEQDKMLRNTALKVLAIMCLTSLGTTALNLLPNFFRCLSDFATIFDESTFANILFSICSWLSSVIGLAENVVLTIMAIMAFKGKELKVPFVDKLLSNIK